MAASIKKYTNFRIVYLNLNVVYILISLFLLYRCIFTKLITHGDDGKHKRLYALGILATISALITGYVGCSAVWFRSKAWTQIQVLLNLLLLPFLMLAYIMERIRREDHEIHDHICEYSMLALFAIGVAIIFTAYEFIQVLRKEEHRLKEKAVDTNPSLNLITWTPRSSTPVNTNLLMSGSVPSLFESHWNLAPFGKVNAWHQLGSVHSMVNNQPTLSLLLDPKQLPGMNGKLAKVQDKDAMSESNV